MAKKKLNVTLSLDEDVLSAVDEFAAFYGLSRSAVVNMNLRAVLGSESGFQASIAELFSAAQSVVSRPSEGVSGALTVN